MRRMFLLVALLSCLCVPCFADDLPQNLADWCDKQKSDYSQESCDGAREFMAALSRFEERKNNFYSSQTPEMVRAEIARRKQEKRTHDLVVAAIAAASFFLLVGLGMLTEKLLKKHRVFSRVRLSAKKRHGSHTLDDVFEIEKRG